MQWQSSAHHWAFGLAALSEASYSCHRNGLSGGYQSQIFEVKVFNKNANVCSQNISDEKWRVHCGGSTTQASCPMNFGNGALSEEGGVRKGSRFL